MVSQIDEINVNSVQVNSVFRGQVPWYIDINVYSLEARVVLELGGIFAGMETHESWIDAISIPLLLLVLASKKEKNVC